MKLFGLNIQSNVATQPLSFFPLRKSDVAALIATVERLCLPCSRARAIIDWLLFFVRPATGLIMELFFAICPLKYSTNFRKSI